MTTSNLEVGQNSDDAHQSGSGTLDTTATTLQMVSSSTASTQKNGGFRFTFAAGTIPLKAKITSADLDLYFENATRDDMNAVIYCHDTDSSPTFAAAPDDINSRTTTTASVSWVEDGVAGGGLAYYSKDIAGPVQEVVDRPSWNGQSLCVLVIAKTNITKQAFIEAYDDAGSNEPHLDVVHVGPRHHMVTGQMNGMANPGPFFGNPLS